jgi:hypothetical protein
LELIDFIELVSGFNRITDRISESLSTEIRDSRIPLKFKFKLSERVADKELKSSLLRELMKRGELSERSYKMLFREVLRSNGMLPIRGEITSTISDRRSCDNLSGVIV